MKRISTVFMSAFLFTACSGNDRQAQDLSAIPELEITATHAFDLEQSIKGISFVPNNVAPWLGRIVLENADLSLSSTDIEGRSPQLISERAYRQTYGLARENASGIFLAINDDTNKLEAFIEADDKGNFAPLSYSGDDVSAAAFCSTAGATQSFASVIIPQGGIKTLSLNIPEQTGSMSAPVEQKTVQNVKIGDNPAKHCSANENKIFSYTDTGKRAFLHTNEFDDEDGFNLAETEAPTNVSGMAQLTLNETNYLLMLNNEDIYLFNSATNALESKLVVQSGLSIGGLEKVKFIASTSHNYGGGAFSEGVLALGQADEDRIVFISKSYLANLLKDAKS
ncbi:MAG: hypothetical protein HKO02_09175 [Hyphomonadaceae bacterium]|nr:hypothetical protein [Hyphomonadaceae bacterium]